MNQYLWNQVILFIAGYILIHKYGRDKDTLDKRKQLFLSWMDYFYTNWQFTSILLNPKFYETNSLITQRVKINEKQMLVQSYLLAFYSSEDYKTKFLPVLKGFIEEFEKIHSIDKDDTDSIKQLRRKIISENEKMIILIKSHRFYKYFLF